MRLFGLLGLLAMAVGCSPRGDPVLISAAQGLEPCASQLVTRARAMGYIEEQVDVPRGFFRVPAHLTRKGRAISQKSARIDALYFNVQCAEDGTATVTAVGWGGAYGPRDSMPKHTRRELDAFAGNLGAVLAEAEPVPPPAGPPPGPVVATPGQCVASQLPEWAGATATQKKALLERCRAENAAPEPAQPAAP